MVVAPRAFALPPSLTVGFLTVIVDNDKQVLEIDTLGQAIGRTSIRFWFPSSVRLPFAGVNSPLVSR